MRSFLLATILGVAAVGFFSTGTASAHEPRGHRHHGRVISGPGFHDLTPHWHKTLTPFGPTYWYGNGVHDVLPHSHRYSPWGGLRSYSYTPFGPTKSYHGHPYFGGPVYPGPWGR